MKEGKRDDQAIHAADYSKKWYVMSAVAMGIILGTIDMSIVNIALPTLIRDLGTEFSIVQWVVLSYLLTISTLMLGVGRLADMMGKKSLYISGMIIFILGSLLCALSPGVTWLIAFRVFQGLGGVMVMALGAGIISEAFPPSERGKSLGLIGSMVSIGVVAGPVLGGIIIEHFTWHWIFLVNLPVGIVGLFMAVRFIPHSRPRGGQRFDYPGALFLFGGILSLLLALTWVQRNGFGDRQTQALFSGALLFFGAFMIAEFRSREPLIDLRLFRKGLLSINIIMGFSSFITMSGVVLLIPFYLENILKFRHGTIGLLMATVPLCAGIASPIAGALSDRVGTWIMNTVGLGFVLVGFLLATNFGQDTTMAGYILPFIPLGIGLGTFQSPNNSAIMHSFPREQYGVASSLLAVTRTMGQTSGVAVIGAFWAWRVASYSGGMPGDGPSGATAGHQMAGLRDVFLVSSLVIGAALILALSGLIYSRRRRGKGNHSLT